jgi:protein-disulfide isomerase
MPNRPRESPRSRRLYQLGALLITVLVVAAVLIAVLTSPSTSELAPGKPVPGARATLALFAGIPQQGNYLGERNAPVTLVEFGDLQCPNCAVFAQNALPTIVSRYVRPGRVLLVFRALRFLGHDSLRAARMAEAVSAQNHLWQFIDLMYRNQGSENSSYVTDRYLHALAGAIPGVDATRALASRQSPNVQAQILQAAAQAKQLHVRGTPSFLLSRTGVAPRPFSPAGLDSNSFTGPLDRMLAGGGA